MGEMNWETSITEIKPNSVRVRGYPIDKLMGETSFGAGVYLLLKGELPDEKTGRLMDAILLSSVDHGATPPSVLAARTVASTGSALNACVAAGILAISESHGGAIENCMRTILEIKQLIDGGMEQKAAVEKLLADYKSVKKRVSGMGHRIHTADPRTDRMFMIASESGVHGRFICILKTVEEVLAEQGKKLPINVDGAIAAILCELEFDPALANGFFMIARTVGLVAQVHEEKTTMRRMRKIHPTDTTYTGPEVREP